MRYSDESSSRVVRREIDEMMRRWTILNENVQRVKENLRFGASMLDECERSSDRLTNWFKTMECVINEVQPVSTLLEKRNLVQLLTVRYKPFIILFKVMFCMVIFIV